jgi:hypothetical protein
LFPSILTMDLNARKSKYFIIYKIGVIKILSFENQKEMWKCSRSVAESMKSRGRGERQFIEGGLKGAGERA